MMRGQLTSCVASRHHVHAADNIHVLQCPGYVIDKLFLSGKSELWGQFVFSSVLTLLGVGHDIKLGWCCG